MCQVYPSTNSDKLSEPFIVDQRGRRILKVTHFAVRAQSAHAAWRPCCFPGLQRGINAIAWTRVLTGFAAAWPERLLCAWRQTWWQASPTKRVQPPWRPVAKAGKWLIREDWLHRHLLGELCHPQTVFVTKPQETVQWYVRERQPMVA